MAASTAIGSTSNQASALHGAAGALAGVVTTTVLHPLDLVKIRLQVHDGGPRTGVPQYRNFLQALHHVARHEGPRSLYQGIQPAIAGSTLAWGTYFYFYTTSKQILTSLKLEQSSSAVRLGFGDHSLAAAMAATGTCLLTNPFWLLKTRMALEVQHAVAPPGGLEKTPMQLVSAMRQVWGAEGLLGFYKGFGPGWVFFVTHGAVQFGCYEELKRTCSERSGAPLTVGEAFGCGLVSKLAAVCTTYPIQLIRSRLQQKGAERLYSGVFDVIRATVAKEGMRGLYKGLLPNIIQRAPQSAITLTAYEQILQALQSAAPN